MPHIQYNQATGSLSLEEIVRADKGMWDVGGTAKNSPHRITLGLIVITERAL